MVTVVMQAISFGPTEVAVCADLYEWHRDKEWIYTDGWDYWAMVVLNNHHHNNIRSLLEPFREQLFYVMANAMRVVRPTEPIRNSIERKRDALLAPYRYIQELPRFVV